jgi:hypothetical protein
MPALAQTTHKLLRETVEPSLEFLLPHIKNHIGKAAWGALVSDHLILFLESLDARQHKM